MKAHARPLIFSLALGLALTFGWAEASQAQTVIPTVRGETFAGDTISLPEVLHGRAGVLVIGFTEASRNAVTQWGEWLAQGMSGKGPPLDYYEMPMLASVPRMLRGFVAGRIKAAVADPAKPHFLVLFDHESEWRSIAHYTAPDDAYVLVVDGKGYVRWQTHGPPTQQARSALLQSIAATPQPALLSRTP